MRTRLSRAALGALVMVVSLVGVAAPAGSVPAQVAPALLEDGTDWSCRPSASHPNPVVMLHGLTGTSESNWAYLAPELVRSGYCVFTTTYGQTVPGAPLGGMGPIAESAQEVADFVARVRAVTGAAEVDVVGHSEGGFIGLYLAKVLGLADRIGRVVALGPPTHGTTVSGITEFADAYGVRPLLDLVLQIAGCAACVDAFPGSPTVRALTTGPIAQPGVEYTIVATRHDGVVTPPSTAFVPEPGVRNVYVQDVCPYDPVGHIGLALDPSVLNIVRNALASTPGAPVSCWFGPPY